MSIPNQLKGRHFYHFTHLDNINSILCCKGLFATNVKDKYNIQHHNIANMSIQNRRSDMKVTVGPGGVVHDYVPFYFASVNPMLLNLLYNKNVDQCSIVFMAVSIDKILEKGVVFTDASANTNTPPSFFEAAEDLDKLDWNLIDSRSWKSNNDGEKHSRMAEALVYKVVPLNWIDAFIVFDQMGKQYIEDCFKRHGYESKKVFVDKYNDGVNIIPFYYKKFFFKGRENETLITGPEELYCKYNNLIDCITNYNNNVKKKDALFDDIEDALYYISDDFCIIPELKGIYELKTDNPMHFETVSDHTLRVVDNIDKSSFYRLLNEKKKSIVELSAYLHDIGKGPREKWSDGIQHTYPDHPSDAIPMLYNILTEYFEKLSFNDVRRICTLVVYHDLMGDIITKDRNIGELRRLALDRKELYMLAALTFADIISVKLDCQVDDIEDSLQNIIDNVLR